MAKQKTPFSYAPITLIEGEPRSGKTNTAVGRVVDAYREDKSIKIFTNFKMYGIRHVHLTLPMMVEYINSKLLKDGYLIIDEAYIGLEAREGQSMLTKVITYVGMQSGKRRLHLIIIVQHGKMIDWRYRWLMTEHIICRYNEKTRMVTLTIKNRRSKKNRTVSYYAPQYWKYFDTEEIFDIPDSKLAKALAGAI